MLEQLGSVARDALGPVRAGEWADRISVEQFCGRNDRLYEHPFGQRQIRTFGWREGARIVSSLDVLEMEVSVRTSGGFRRHRAGLVASVVTEPELRGKGRAGRLLAQVVSAYEDQYLVLHSEVPPAFYEKFGFRRADVGWVEGLPSAESASGDTLALAEFVGFLGERRRTLARAPDDFHLVPSPLYWEWQRIRLEYFAELRGADFPQGTFFRWDHGPEGHLMAAAPNFVSGYVEGLWVESRCSSCQKALAGLARTWGLPRWRCWGEPGPGALHPMFRPPGAGKGQWVDVQLGEWW